MKKLLASIFLLFICSIAFSQITLTSTVSNVSCFGGSNGSATVSATGGTGAYTYTWIPTGINSSIITGLAAGSYTVYAEDAVANTNSLIVTITEPTVFTSNITSVNHVTCFGLGDGNATASPIGGIGGPYIYSWTPSGQTSATATNLSPGAYSVTIIDFVGCTATATVNINQPAQLGSITNANNVKCFGTATGTVSATGTGGSVPYTYLWPTLSSTLSTVNNVAVGVYSVIVTDANNCSVSQTVAVIEPTQITTANTVSASTCSGCNGAFNIAASGGSGFYMITVSNGATTFYNSNQCPGPYTVTITDANNCVYTNVVNVPLLSSMTAAISSTNANCGQSDGSACANVTGAVGATTFIWNNLSSTSCINLIPAGAYSYTVTDSNGCTASANTLVSSIGGPTVSISSQTNASCFGSCNGTATAFASGGTSPYSYSWSQGNMSPTASNLCAGLYNVTLTDASGCIGTASVIITQPSAIIVTTTGTNAACQTNCNGAASATVTGGAGSYTYQWMGPSIASGSTSNNPIGMCPGLYTVVVTDAMGCVSATMVNVSSANSIPNASVTSTIYNETCLYTGDGAIDVSVSGTNPGPFTYQWNNGASTQDLNNITSGSYLVTIYDTNLNCLSLYNTLSSIGTNCGTISGNVFVDNNSDCMYNAGDNNLGSVQIMINPGNRLGYTNPAGNYVINNLPYGTYTVTANTNTVNYLATCSTMNTSFVNAGSPNSINNNFTREYIPLTQPDLLVSAYSNGIVPGFACTVNYYLSNYNNINANGIYKVTLPSAFILNITQVSASTYTISGDTVMWNFTNVTNTYTPPFFIKFTTPLSTPLGSIFTTCMWAQPTVTDLNYTNNTYCYSRFVTGSFDPNDKTVSPVGIGPNGDIAATETDLSYLIRFQNTGNGPAVNIVVKDTLSPNVDINTFEMLSSSHNYNIDILPGNILRWKFNNIMLPDSNSNEPGSHGYIQYRIKRNNNNTPGTQIKNTAYIYFDFNEPVVTNTAINTIETITGIKYQNIADDQWIVYPNPSTGILNLINNSIATDSKLHIQVVNAIGQLVYEESTNANHKTIDLTMLSNGVYFVKLVSDKRSSVKRIVLSK